MNKIKKQFKDFWLYFRLTKYGVNLSDGETVKRYIPVLMGVIAGIFVAFIQFLITKNQSGISFTFGVMFLPFACGSAIGSGMATCQKPSLIAAAPFTPKQRMVFSYLATLLRAVIIYVIAMAAFLLVILVAGCLISIAVGEWVLVIDSGFISEFVAPTPYEVAFRFLFCAFYFFSYLAICNTDRAKYRNIATACFFFGVLILSTVLTNVCGYAMQSFSSFRQYFFFSIDMAEGLNALTHPWIVILVLSILTAGSIAASVFTTIKRFKSSDI
ncbi:MAG: hypothetical protein K2O67_06375 [Clostridia bacterium]|nr:hypothetical protein [Clostridia bacterium]